MLRWSPTSQGKSGTGSLVLQVIHQEYTRVLGSNFVGLVVFVQDIAVVDITSFIVCQNGAVIGVLVLQAVFLGLWTVSMNLQGIGRDILESKLGFLPEVLAESRKQTGMDLPGPPGLPRPWI